MRLFDKWDKEYECKNNSTKLENCQYFLKLTIILINLYQISFSFLINLLILFSYFFLWLGFIERSKHGSRESGEEES